MRIKGSGKSKSTKYLFTHPDAFDAWTEKMTKEGRRFLMKEELKEDCKVNTDIVDAESKTKNGNRDGNGN